MNFTTPPITPTKPVCPDRPMSDRSNSDRQDLDVLQNVVIPFGPFDENNENVNSSNILSYFTPEKSYSVIKCDGAPRKKSELNYIVILGNRRYRISRRSLSLNIDNDNDSCKKCLFPGKESKIPRPVKTEKKNNTPKFAQSLRLKIKLSQRK